MPFGFGVPTGVVLGNERGLSWEVLTILYFFSDVVLAFVFEAIIKIFLFYSKQSAFLTQFKVEIQGS